MEFSFRPLSRQDLPLFVGWLTKPHVSQWWKEPKATLEEVEKEYSASIDGNDPTVVYVIQYKDRPIGIIQSYLVSDYPEHAKSIQLDKSVGIDLFIGEEDCIGKGYGTEVLRQFVRRIVRDHYKDAEYVVVDPEIGNLPSIKAFEKAGFQKGRVVSGEYGPEQLLLLRL
jgi:aminoglycoside 6'-N-acetyltransferase